MNRKRFSTLILALLIAATGAAAQPRDTERYSTEPDQDLKRVSVKGKIEKITGQRAVLKTEDGQQVTVHLGPQRYWQDKGYHLESGAHVTVDGWGDMYGDDGGFLFAGGIYGDGFSIELMNSHGCPMWADRDEWGDDWYPSRAAFDLYFGPSWGYGPWGYWGPPPRWWHRPPWWYNRGHHYRHDGPPRHEQRHDRRHGGWR